MPAKKKASKKAAKRKASGAVGVLNENQRKQLEALGYVKKGKKSPGRERR